MRKVVMLFALVFASVSVHAASLNWQIAALAKSPLTPAHGEARAADYVVQIFLQSDYDAVMGLLSSGVIAADSALIQAQDVTKTTGGVSGKWLDITAGTYEYFFVVYDASSLTTATMYAVSSSQSAATYEGTDTATTVYWGTDSTVPTTVGGWQEIVPEPTSLALLALGVAAIGLRRKVK